MKLYSSQILEGDKKETKKKADNFSGSTQNKTDWKTGDVLYESGFVLFSAPFLETKAFCIFLTQWRHWIQRT